MKSVSVIPTLAGAEHGLELGSDQLKTRRWRKEGGRLLPFIVIFYEQVRPLMMQCRFREFSAALARHTCSCLVESVDYTRIHARHHVLSDTRYLVQHYVVTAVVPSTPPLGQLSFNWKSEFHRGGPDYRFTNKYSSVVDDIGRTHSQCKRSPYSV